MDEFNTNNAASEIFDPTATVDETPAEPTSDTVTGDTMPPPDATQSDAATDAPASDVTTESTEPAADAVAEPATEAASDDSEPSTDEEQLVEEPRDVEMRKLSCSLDEETLAALRKDSADLAVEICDANEQLKRFTEETKASVKAKENRRRALIEKIDSRSEVKNIECVWVKNFGNGRKELLRVDSGSVVDWKPLSHEDRQQKLKASPQFVETVTAPEAPADTAPEAAEAPAAPSEPAQPSIFDEAAAPVSESELEAPSGDSYDGFTSPDGTPIEVTESDREDAVDEAAAMELAKGRVEAAKEFDELQKRREAKANGTAKPSKAKKGKRTK